MKAIFSDESVIDSDSERIIVSGVDLERFSKNPVLLFVHNYMQMPVGRVKDISVEGTKLVGEVEFDKDEFSQKVEAKYRDGFMNGFSVGIAPLEKTNDPEFLLPGQKRMTIVRSELFEISCAILPSNAEAVVVREQKVKDASGAETDIVYKSFRLESAGKPGVAKKQFNKVDIKQMSKLTKKIGLPDNADEDAIVEKIAQILDAQKGIHDENEALKKQISEAEKKSKKEKVEALVKKALDENKIQKGQESFYIKMAEADFEETEKHLNSLDSYTPIVKTLKDSQPGAYAGREAWTFQDWQKNDPAGLKKMKENDQEKFKKLIEDLKR